MKILSDKELVSIINKWFNTNTSTLQLTRLVAEAQLKASAKRAGSTKSKVKSAAARINGLKGGRPRKKVTHGKESSLDSNS